MSKLLLILDFASLSHKERGGRTGNRCLWWHFQLCGNQNGWSAEIGLLCNSFVLFAIWNRLKTRRAHGGAGGGRRSQCHPLSVGDRERQTPGGGVWRHWQGGRPLGLHPQTLSRWRVSGWLSPQKLPWLALHFSSLSSSLMWVRYPWRAEVETGIHFSTIFVFIN